jgi:nucleoside-diphosphate kinase
MDQQTLIIVKPDGVARGLIGEVIRRFEARGLRIAKLSLQNAPKETVEAHYDEHRERPFFGDVVAYLTSGPIVVMAVEGPNAVGACRAMMGATNPAEAAPGTIRGDFAVSLEENVVHGSADPESAHRELGIWFP